LVRFEGIELPEHLIPYFQLPLIGSYTASCTQLLSIHVTKPSLMFRFEGYALPEHDIPSFQVPLDGSNTLYLTQLLSIQAWTSRNGGLKSNASRKLDKDNRTNEKRTIPITYLIFFDWNFFPTILPPF
jgi:hypothetical protein